MRCRRCVPSHDQVGFPHLTVTVGVICAAGGGSVSVGVRARDVAVCLLPAAEEIPPEARLDVSRRTRTTPRRSGADRPMRVISRPRSCERPRATCLGGALRPRGVACGLGRSASSSAIRQAPRA